MSNDQQSAYWNEVAGPKWVRLGDEMDARLEAINALLLAEAAPRQADKVLDVGCGTGTTTLPLARLVAPGGHVTGADISAPMLEVAARRCADQPDVTLLRADAQTHDFGAAAYNLILSRFGVMFFADPAAAFGNLRRALQPGGRFCFVCWAGLAENPHWRVPFDIVAAALGPPAAKPPHAPGPMALSDPSHTGGLLRAAGFTEIALKPVQVPIIGRSLEDEARVAGILGPSGALLDEKQASPEQRAVLAAEILQALRVYDTADGPRLPATVLVCSASG